MADLDISKATTPTAIDDYSVDSQATDGATGSGKTYYHNTNFNKWHGHYKKVAKIKKSLDAFATWVVGKGWKAESTEDQIVLENIRGWGEDTFMSILWNMLVTKKVNGDAYAEIIRDGETGELINIKTLDPASITHVVGENGLIEKYQQRTKTGNDQAIKDIPIERMLHLCNDRVADEVHGVSVIEAVEWVVETQEEILRDYRRQLHRNGVARIIYVDVEDTTKINTFKAQWKEAIDKGDVLILPKGTAEVKDTGTTLQDPIPFLRYLDQMFWIAIGTPRVILGGSEEFTEASSKIGYLTFEQIYTKEVEELIADIWNQLGIKITINKPASIKNELLQSEDKNTGQTGFQPKETTAGLTRE